MIEKIISYYKILEKFGGRGTCPVPRTLRKVFVMIGSTIFHLAPSLLAGNAFFAAPAASSHMEGRTSQYRNKYLK